MFVYYYEKRNTEDTVTWFFKFSRIVYSSLSALYEFCHNILEIWHHLEQYSVILTRFLKKFARLIFILIFWNGWRCCKGRHSYQKFTTKFAVFWHFYKCFVKFCFNLTKNEKLFLTNEIENEQISKFHRFRKSGQNNWILLEISSKHQQILGNYKCHWYWRVWLVLISEKTG